MGDPAAMETSALTNLLAVRERMKEKKNGALKSAKLNTSIAAKIKTKIINNSSILKISLKHNNKALAMALSAEKEKCRRLEIERMYLQKEVKMVHFHNAVLRQNMNAVNKTLREIELFMNLNLNTAIEVSANTECSVDFLPVSASQRNSECLSRSSEISLNDDCTVRCTAVPLRVPYKQADDKLCQGNNSESTKKISLFAPGCTKLSNQSKGSVESSNAEAAVAVNKISRVNFKCIEQGSENPLVLNLDCLQSDCPSADIKGSCGGSGYVTKRRKRSTMSLSSNKSLAVGHDQDNASPSLSDSFRETDNCESNGQADEQDTSCRESYTMKQCSDQKKNNVLDHLQFKDHDKLQSERAESGAEMDITASDSGMIAIIPSETKYTDSKDTREESDKCDRVSLRKVRYSWNEKKLKNTPKSGSDQIKKTSSKIKLKNISEVAQQIEPQFEIMTSATSSTVTGHQFESKIKRWDRDHNDCRRTYVVQLSQVKLEQNDCFDEESKETEQNVVLKNVKVLENFDKNQSPLGTKDPLEGCPYNILNFEESHRNNKSPLLQENICRTVGKKGKNKVSNKTCEKEGPLECCNISVLRQKENEVLNGPVLQVVSHLISNKKQSGDKNSCDAEENLSESCALKSSLHAIQTSNFEAEPTKIEKHAVYKNSQMLENSNKNPDNLPREYPLEVNIVNGSLFSETKDTSNMQTLKLQPFSVSEKHKHKVDKKPCIIDTPLDDFTTIVTFEGRPELQHQPTLCEKPKKTISKKGKQKVSKQIDERETTLEICSASAFCNRESNEISNLPIHQEKASWLIPKKKNKVNNECSESSVLPLKSCTIKTLPSAVANQAVLLGGPSCITEKNREVGKNSCDTTGAAKESHSVKMSFGESQDVLDLPPLRDNTCILIENPKKKKNHESDLLSGNSSAEILSRERSNVTDFQEQPSSFLEKSKPKVSKNTCESRTAPHEIYSLKQPPFEESLEISNTTTVPEKSSSVIEKDKKCVLKNTPGCLENFTNISSVECQLTALQEQPLNVPKRKGAQKVNKGTCEEPLYELPLERKKISNIPVCIKSKAVNEVEQKHHKTNYELNFDGSDEDRVLDLKCSKKEKACRRESKIKKKQNRRLRAAPYDESEQHSQGDELETCDQYTKPDVLKPSKRIYRVSFASSKRRRETYVVGVSEPELFTSADELLEDKLIKPTHGVFGAAESEEFSTSTENVQHSENGKGRRGTYVVRAPQSEVGLNSDLKDKNVKPRRGTYFVRPLNDKVCSLATVLSEDLAADGYEDNVCVSDCTNSSVLLDQVTKSRRCTYVVREPDASDCNVLRNSTCMLSESLQSNSGHSIVAKLNNMSESSEWYNRMLTNNISSRRIRSMCNPLPLTENNVPLLEDPAGANTDDVTAPVHTISANSNSEEYQKIDFLDIFDRKTEQFMVDMISDSILVDSTVDCPSVLEFSNITAHENIPFTPRKSSNGLTLLELTPTEERNNLEPSDSLRACEEINHEEIHNENIVQKIELALNKAPSVKTETPRKTAKALQDLTNIGDNTSNPPPKTSIKLEEQSSPPQRRRRAPVNYAEPKLCCKLRRGDQHTNTEFLSSPIFKGTKKNSGKTRVKKATVKSV